VEELEITLLHGANFSPHGKCRYKPGLHMKLEFGRKLEVLRSAHTRAHTLCGVWLSKIYKGHARISVLRICCCYYPYLPLYLVINISLEPMAVIKNTDCRISGPKFPSLCHISLGDVSLEHFCHGATLCKVSPYATPELRYASHVPFEGFLVYKKVIYTSCWSLCLLRKKWIGMGKKFYVPCILTP
jgi:hypothetical protein